MKRQINDQHGSAHVLAIVVLVAVLLFALGWIFWQNFIYKDTIVQQGSESTAKQEVKTQTDLPQDQSSYLVIKEWGVKIPLKDPISDAVYTFNNENGVVYLSTKKLDAKSQLPNGEGCSVFAISRGLKGQPKHEIPGEDTQTTYYGDGEGEVKIGSYYYTGEGGNGLCTNDGASESDIRAAFNSAAKGIVAQ